MVALRAIIPGTTPRLNRDRDANAGDRSAPAATDGQDLQSPGVLEERRFYCQNWRHDVVMLLDSSGGRAEGYRYSAYGVPFGIPRADVNGDGTVNMADYNILAAATGNSLGDPGYVVTADINLDGVIDSNDFAILSNTFGATLGRGALSSMTTSGNGGVRNRIGYAGYQFDDAANKYHVRNRVLDPLNGRWLRRDPLGYVDGPNLYEYARGRAIVRRDYSGLWSGTMGCNGMFSEQFCMVGPNDVIEEAQVAQTNVPTHRWRNCRPWWRYLVLQACKCGGTWQGTDNLWLPGLTHGAVRPTADGKYYCRCNFVQCATCQCVNDKGRPTNNYGDYCETGSSCTVEVELAEPASGSCNRICSAYQPPAGQSMNDVCNGTPNVSCP